MVAVVTVALALWSAWALAGLALLCAPDRATAAMKLLFFELKPFALPILVVYHVGIVYLLPGWADWAQMFLTGFNVANWLVLRDVDDDDDRWKRRRRKLTERVTRQGARLVPVPEGAS